MGTMASALFILFVLAVFLLVVGYDSYRFNKRKKADKQ